MSALLLAKQANFGTRPRSESKRRSCKRSIACGRLSLTRLVCRPAACTEDLLVANILAATQKTKLHSKEEDVVATRARCKDLRRKQGAARIDKAKAVLQHHAKVGAIRTAYHAMLEAQLLLLEARSDVAYLRDKNVEIKQRLDEEKTNIETLVQEQAVKKTTAAAALRAVTNIEMDEDTKLEYAKRTERLKEEDIQNEIEAEEAKLTLITANNENALREYESWTAKIQKERVDHENQEARVQALEEKISRVRGQWEPRLDELVGRINDAFSYNFEQISCAGEVGVHKDEDFDKWAIEIRVKFRYVDPRGICDVR